MGSSASPAPRDTGTKPSSGDNAGTTAGTVSSTNMGSTGSATTGGGASTTRLTLPPKTDSGTAPAATPSQPKVLLLGGTPDPEKGGDSKGVPAGVKQLGAPAKTPAQVEAERKRQAGLPNDTGGPPDRMRMENAARENVSARQSNLINPGQGDGTTSNLGAGVAPPLQGTGNNPTGGKAGGGPNSGNPGGSKPDDPSASNACGAGNNC
jgi:hypothetical protein